MTTVSNTASGDASLPLNIVTSRWDVADGHTLEGYKNSGSYRGYAGLEIALSKSPQQVGDEVRAATVLGRGGAGFPAGTKWGFCPPGVWPRYIVVNGDESEPGTYKDRILMERDPHQLIEGCLIAAYAIGAAQVFLYVRGEMAHAQERIAAALNEAYAANLVGNNILGTDFSVDIVLHWGAGAYIVGEETALIGRSRATGHARLKPPYFPAARASTSSRRSSTTSRRCRPAVAPEQQREAYKAYGSEASPGTRLVAVSGHVKTPGVFEIHQGTTTYRELFEDERYGGGYRDGHSLKMFIPGGASAPWFFPEDVDLPLEGRVVGAAGSMLGSGAIVVMDDSTDAVKACLRVVRFFARESCGKCSPCREGTSWEEKILQRILDGQGRPSDIDLLLDVADNISPGPYPVAADPSQGLAAVPFPPKQTTICPLGPSSVAPITSAIRRFRHEFEAKITKRDLIAVASASLDDRPLAGSAAGAAAQDGAPHA